MNKVIIVSIFGMAMLAMPATSQAVKKDIRLFLGPQPGMGCSGSFQRPRYDAATQTCTCFDGNGNSMGPCQVNKKRTGPVPKGRKLDPRTAPQ